NERQRRDREQNPDKYREYSRRENPIKRLANARRLRASNRARYAKYQRDYYARNPQKCKARHRAYASKNRQVMASHSIKNYWKHRGNRLEQMHQRYYRRKRTKNLFRLLSLNNATKPNQ